MIRKKRETRFHKKKTPKPRGKLILSVGMRTRITDDIERGDVSERLVNLLLQD